ncbi:hypothetical protein H0E84_04630 [Luteimonas sp. SJ-92]|uniref:Uncharacterized protein n=1 Tax=Luteimonas salinisoli TaxID=2752307 RepID=A0A853JAG5_9GAMM|nr:hypothetical protein [Luteimonas salinisoli]NZA25659.1 hypothetical protein [Luteimonas salinisoli]
MAIVLLAAVGGGCSGGSAPPPELPEDAGVDEKAAAPAVSASPPAQPPQRLALDRLPASPGGPPSRIDSWWRDPLPEVLDALQDAAATGDTEAGYILGVRSAGCRTILRRDTPESLIHEYRRKVIYLGAGDSRQERENWERQYRENRERDLQKKLREYEDCAVVGQERVSAGADWLESAGRAGNASAQLSFITHALEEYATRGALIADVEEARRRQKLAREWLEQLVHDGNEQALDRYVEALDGRYSLYPRDERASMAHAYALELVRSRRAGDFDRLWREGPERYGSPTPAEWDEISSRGREIYLEHFQHAPVWPGR